MEDRGSGYCSSPPALISIRNMFLGFFSPLFQVCLGSVLYPAALSIPATTTSPLGCSPKQLFQAHTSCGDGTRQEGLTGIWKSSGMGLGWHWNAQRETIMGKGKQKTLSGCGSHCNQSGCSRSAERQYSACNSFTLIFSSLLPSPFASSPF